MEEGEARSGRDQVLQTEEEEEERSKMHRDQQKEGVEEEEEEDRDQGLQMEVGVEEEGRSDDIPDLQRGEGVGDGLPLPRTVGSGYASKGPLGDGMNLALEGWYFDRGQPEGLDGVHQVLQILGGPARMTEIYGLALGKCFELLRPQHSA
jgi:hypothetical protein